MTASNSLFWFRGSKVVLMIILEVGKQNIIRILVHCVKHAICGPTLIQHWDNVSCLLGLPQKVPW